MTWAKKRAGEWIALGIVLVLLPGLSTAYETPPSTSSSSLPRRMLVDTDVDTDDLFALLYLLKFNRSLLHVTAVTINANSWSDAGHAVNHIYDLLFMMGRDDVSVGVGGEGGIPENSSGSSTILPDVGGYLPLIEQGATTAGYCRYRQSIPVGKGGRLDDDTNYGLRRSLLPQGRRHYIPLKQATAQQVMMDTISSGPTTVLLLGAHTNLAVFLMSNPQLKRNVEHVYAMGGSLTRNVSVDDDDDRDDRHVVGNLFTAFSSNPYAEFNMFQDPFAAYEVMVRSGVPVTLVPLDATDTVPITEYFFGELGRRRSTYEAEYVYQSLKMSRETWFDDHFFQGFFMWDSFTAGIASAAAVAHPNADADNNYNNDNEFSVMEYMNITVVTSNQPYGIGASDGSNPFFDGRNNNKVPKFGLKNGGVHSGHVQMGLGDPFCLVNNGQGKCQDGRTRIATGETGAARVLVARKAKAPKDPNSPFNTEFAKHFLDVINRPEQSGRFNYTAQFPDHKQQVFYRPEPLVVEPRKLGKPVIFDMDMSAGDFLALIYLLKVPREDINLVAVFVTPTGWASAATIDIVYDVLHMMGRDDIPVGLGDFFALNQSYPPPLSSNVGDCKYAKAIPHGSGGLLDSDTLYGLARSLPRSPRRYTAEDSVRYGAPRDTDHPELRQPRALEIWNNLTATRPKSKFRILTNGPLTTLATILNSDEKATAHIRQVFVVGGHIKSNPKHTGNVYTIPSNNYAEFNMFLDPMAAQTVLHTPRKLRITLIPHRIQRLASSFTKMLRELNKGGRRKTPEAIFATRLVSRLQRLKRQHPRYRHMRIFMGETLGAPVMVSRVLKDHMDLVSTFVSKRVRVQATGDESTDGELQIDQENGRPVRVLRGFLPAAYFSLFAHRLRDTNQNQSAALLQQQQPLLYA